MIKQRFSIKNVQKTRVNLFDLEAHDNEFLVLSLGGASSSIVVEQHKQVVGDVADVLLQSRQRELQGPQ